MQLLWLAKELPYVGTEFFRISNQSSVLVVMFKYSVRALRIASIWSFAMEKAQSGLV